MTAFEIVLADQVFTVIKYIISIEFWSHETIYKWYKLIKICSTLV